MSIPITQAKHPLFVGGGEIGVLMRVIDWSQTAIGAVESWSPALQMMVRLLLANRFQLILWWGPEFCQLYNDAYLPVLGAKHPQAMGQPGRECWPEIWHIIGPLIERPFHGGPATWMEDILLEINRSGFIEETHFTIAYSPVPDDTAPGGIGGVLGTIHEITEKVVGERRLEALRDLGARSVEAKTVEEACAIVAETVVQHPEDVPFVLAYVLDDDHRRARLAGAAGVHMGETASPMLIELDNTLSHVQPWPLAEVVRTKVLRLVEDLPGKLGRENVPPGPWSDPPHSGAVVPIRSNIAHQLAGFLVLGVSARLRFDDRYRDFCELVASQVATAIANARAYEEERKRAEALAEIDRAKTLFFSNVSHEFRTPLTLMLGPLEEMLAQRHGTLEEERAELKLVHRNGLRLLRLVNTLLDFSRIEAGRVQATYEPTDLAVLTAELTSSFRSAIEKAGLYLVVDCPPLPEPVYVDRDMWEKIVLNLLSNAFKFTFVGEIRVGLRPSADGTAAEFTVRDTGTGIPAAELPRLFERFRRVEGARGRTQEGTGIGLALVQELVKLHGGQIAVESTVDQGSVFTVRLPFGTAHLPRERVGAATTLASAATRAEAYVEEALRWLPEEGVSGIEQEPEQRGTAATVKDGVVPPLPSTSCPRILLADDNADMRDYVRRLLSTHYQVTAVGDGQEALAAALAAPPDLVLSDVMMPRLDGFELLKALRHDPRTRTVPVMLLTARAGEESRVEGSEAGADDYIVKPFSARELLARVSARLEIARIRAQAEAVLRDSELRYRLTARTTNDVLWDWNLVTDEARWTNALQSLFGYPEDDIGPDATWWYEHIHPEDRERVVSSIHARIESGEQFWSDEYRFRRQDESYAYILDRGYVVHDETGKPVRMVGAMIDLTARKQAEAEQERLVAELRQEREKLAAILDHITDEVWFCNLAKHFTLLNTVRTRGLGPIWHEYTHARLGDRWEELEIQTGEGRRRRRDETPLLRALRGEVIRDEVEVIRHPKTGKWLYRLVNATPLRDESGSILGAVASVRDVTEEHKAADAQARLLTEVQRANDELQQFAHIVSHDLNEPLRTMSSYVELLTRRLKGKLDGGTQEYMAFITGAAKRMQQMLTDLLAYTRAGQTPEFQAVDCETVLAQVLSDLQAQIAECGAVITHDPLPTVPGDATRVRQVLQNLIGNALKFRAAKPPRIHITAIKEALHWRIAVRDNGIGIDPQQTKRLFQVFQRLHSQSEYPGSGIGLAICKKIVEQHGGHIWVESRPGEGAIFYFTIGEK